MSKKGLISLNIFVLALSLFLLMSFLAYYFNSVETQNLNEIYLKQEALIEGHKLHSALLTSLVFENSSIEYQDKLARNDLKMELKGKNIITFIETNENLFSETISTFGFEFCSNYTYSASSKKEFKFDGTCMSMS